MMTRFGRPSRMKDIMGATFVALTVGLLWAQSALAAGGAATVAPEATEAVGAGAEVTMVAGPAGVALR